MGLRMDRLHAPTVASGPTSNGHVNGSSAPKTLMELMDERDTIQAELQALGQVLQSHGVNMTTSLTTFDGYPRSDIDVAQVRTTRARTIRLKNDYKTLMDKIEKGLHEHHANGAAATPTARAQQATSSANASTSQAQAGSSRGAAAPAIEPPFAKVNSVVASSPAEDAGLKIGDRITKFGYVKWGNHEKLARVAQVVQANEGREVAVRVLRAADQGGGSETLDLKLTPRHNWGGRGMLGCHLLPL